MRARLLLPALLILLLVAGTIVAAVAAGRAAERNAANRAERAADSAAASLRESLAGARGSLVGTGGLFAASEEVTQEEFSRYGRRVLGASGLLRVTWVERVPRAQRAAYERRTGLRVTTTEATPGLRSGQSELYPTRFVAELGGSAVVLGIDVGADPVRRESVERAIATGSMAASGEVVLLASSEPGVVLFVPVYRGDGEPGPAARSRALLGLVSGAFRRDALLDPAVRSGGEIRIEVRDGTRALTPTLADGQRTPPVDVDVGGRTWQVSAARPARSWTLELTILAAGAALTALAVWLLLTLLRRERFAQNEVQRTTGALSASESRYRTLVDSMAEGVVLQAQDGRIIDCNPAAQEILGLSWDQMMGRDSIDPRWRSIHEDGTEFPGSEHPAMVTLRSGRPQRGVPMGVHKPDGALTWISISTDPVTQDGQPAVVSTFSDITVRFEAEREQAALHYLAKLVAEGAEPSAVFEAVAERAARSLQAEASAVVRFDRGRARGQIVGAWNVAGTTIPADGVPVDLDDTTAAGIVARTGEYAQLAGTDEAPLAWSRTVPGLPIHRAGGCPIWVDNTLWGALTLATSRKQDFGADAQERMRRLSGIASLAIVSSDARSKLAKLAATDELTDLANRRMFNERLGEELERARRHGRPLSLVTIDIDSFKQINDTHGHPTGDAVLVEFARRLTALARRGELVARIGGEEFAWVLPETTGEAAVAAAERMRAAIAAEPFPGVGRVTVSAGVCGLEDAEGGTDIVRRADVALYWAKSHGRDRVFRYTQTAMKLLPDDGQDTRLARATTLSNLRALADAVEAKSPTSQRHSERVAELAQRLALVAGWTPAEADRLRAAALVHDVGKVAVAEEVLAKPADLDADERRVIERHVEIGATMLAGVLAPDQISWVRGHHERHDGTGYPDGLAGDAIPAGARLLALAEAWDAMTLARPYGPPMSEEAALAEVRDNVGSQFSPDAVAALEALLREQAGNGLSAGGGAAGEERA